MQKMEKENNIYIQLWKKTASTLIAIKDLWYEEYTLSKKSNDIRELASKQLSLLDECRKNKEESLYKQSDEEQKQFIDYLEQVIMYGNVEGIDNVGIRNSII